MSDKDTGITGAPTEPTEPPKPADPPVIQPPAPKPPEAPTEPQSGTLEERMKNQESLTTQLLAAVTGLTDAITALGKQDEKPVKVPWTHRGGRRQQ